MSEQAMTYAYGTLSPTQLVTARLRIVHETLVEVLQDVDLLPTGASAPLVEALRQVIAARALPAERETR